MKYIITVFLIFCMTWMKAQDNLVYSSLTIPDSLKKNANVVYRLDEGFLDISSPSHYTFKTRQIITILNAEGAKYLRHSHYLNKFIEIDKAEVTVYNSLGIVSKKYNKNSK